MKRRVSIGLILIACLTLAACGGGGGSAPAVPTGLTVTIGDNAGELTISWTASATATSYNLYWGNSAGVTTATGTKIAGAASPYAHTALTNGTRYYYVVTAVNADGESAASAEASGLPQINPVGTLDAALAGTGLVQYATDEGWGSDVAVDASGRIVISGRIDIAPNTHMALWRYNADGTPDTTFGGGDGLVTTTGTAGGTLDEGADVAIDGSGRIVVAGYSNTAGSRQEMVLWRFLDDGTADASFGTAGVVIYDRGFGEDDWADALLIDASGRILVTGVSSNATPDRDMALWRYTDAGALDTTFGGTGVVFQHNAAGGNGDDEGYGLALDANGNIVVVGDSSNTSPPNTDLVVWRFTDAGALDAGFDGDGIALYSGGYSDIGAQVTVDIESRVLAVGTSDSATSRSFVVLRYTADGVLDTSFSGDGVASYTTADGALGWCIGMDSRQRIVAAGASGMPGAANDLAVIRLLDDGSFDPAFATTGVAIYHYPAVSRSDAGGIAFDATGRIVVAGSIEVAVPPPPIHMTFWRYE